MNVKTVVKTLDNYNKSYGNTVELTKLRNLALQGVDLFSRSQMLGHITCGAVIINPEKKILMINHRNLNKWLVPGGHIEREDSSLIDAAKREAFEETSVDRNVLRVPIWGSKDFPLDIDYHFIPENPKKNEGSHYHWDFRYVFEITSAVLKAQEEEVLGVEWRPLSDAPGKIAEKIHKIMR